MALTQDELDKLTAEERASTTSSLLAGVDYTAKAAPTSDTSVTRTRPGKENTADFIPTVAGGTPTKEPSGITVSQAEELINPGVSGDLLASLRSGVLTGAQVQGGARTFGGGATPSAAKKGDAARLRIGSKIDTTARANVKRKKQTNTLGLNLGSSVGLQV